MQELAPNTYTFAEYELDLTRRLLLRARQSIPLNAKAFDLLVVLIENRERVIAKEELMNLVWRDQFVEESNLTVQVSALRKALGEKKDEHRFIVTVSGRGYRFVADVSEVGAGARSEGFSIESHTLSRIVIERETEISDESTGAPDPETKTLLLPSPGVSHEAARPALSEHATTAGQTRGATESRRAIVVAVSAFIALASLVLVFALNKFLSEKKSDGPFQQFQLSRLTNNGKVLGAAIAPDGKYVAYVLAENEGKSLWVRQVGTASNIRVLPPGKSEFWGVTFSHDGAYLYYNLFAGDKPDIYLYRVPSLGGMAQKIPNIIAPAFTLSPDGGRIAYTTSYSARAKTYLSVSNADGSNGREVAERQQPSNFEVLGQVIAWSPDGDTLACVVDNYAPDAHYSSIMGVRVNDGAERPLSRERWYNVSSLQWLKDRSGLFMVASDKPLLPTQIWFLSYPSGGARKITNDLSHYGWLGVASDGQTLVSVQTNSVNGFWVGKKDQDIFREVLSEIGALSPFTWLADGKIVFRSHADGGSNLWLMEADGSGRRQLTTDMQVSHRGLCASPDGKHVIFVSWSGGKQNLWRLDVDHGSLTRLTNGDGEGYPNCSPDGRWVVYQNGLGVGKPTLWRTSLNGGTPQQLVETFASKPSMSQDGKRIAYIYMDADKWRIGIIAAEGGKILQNLDLPATVIEHLLRWAPDGEALYYISTVGDVGNVWSLPLDGAPPHQLTNFTSHLLGDFVLSPDGERFAFTRGTESRDVVLLNNFR